MCGLIGVAGNLSLAHKTLFDEGLYMSALRGRHSTGFAAMGWDGKRVDVLKDACTPDWLQDHRQYDKLSSVAARVLLGHNRHKTMGAINRKNAHPFVAGPIIGAHNGTIERNKIEGYTDFETDSEALFNSIAIKGLRDTIKDLPGDHRGAWALTWIDMEAKNGPTINFLRNANRPLSLAMSEDRKVLMWMSEGPMLRSLVARNNVKLNDDGVFLLRENTLLSFTVPMGSEVFGKPLMSGVEHDTTPLPPLAYQGYGYNHRTHTTRVSTPVKPKNEPQKKPESSQDDLLKRAGLPRVGSTSPLRPMPNSDSGSSTSSKTNDPSDADAYFEGYGAPEGTKATDCPYKPAGCLQAREWRRGLLDARTALARSKSIVRPLFMEGPGKTSIDEKEFRKLTGSTCCWCDNVVEFGAKVDWVDRTSFICEDCSKGDTLVKSN